MKRVIKIILIPFVFVAAILVGFYFAVFGGLSAIPDRMWIDGVEVVKDGYVSAYIVDLGPGEVALVDSGNDESGRAVLGALAERGLGPDAVKAIFLTHGDSDHTRGRPPVPQRHGHGARCGHRPCRREEGA